MSPPATPVGSYGVVPFCVVRNVRMCGKFHRRTAAVSRDFLRELASGQHRHASQAEAEAAATALRVARETANAERMRRHEAELRAWVADHEDSTADREPAPPALDRTEWRVVLVEAYLAKMAATHPEAAAAGWR